jgi:hypothetical protein
MEAAGLASASTARSATSDAVASTSMANLMDAAASASEPVARASVTYLTTNSFIRKEVSRFSTVTKVTMRVKVP